MRTILRFDEDDLRQLVAEKTGEPLENIIAINTEEPYGYNDESMHPIFYIEVEKRDR